MASVRSNLNKSGVTTFSVLYRRAGRQRSETFPTAEQAETFKGMVDSFGPDKAFAMLLEAEKTKAKVTVDELFERWHEAKRADMESGDITKGTWFDYRHHYDNRVRDHIGFRDIATIDGDDIQAIVDKMTEEGLAAQTVLVRFNVVRQMFAWATGRRQQLLERTPCEGIELPSQTRGVARGLRLTEVQQLLDAVRRIDLDLYDLIAFLVSTGWRKSEAFGLIASDVEDDGTAIYVTMGRAWRRGEGVVEDGKSEASFGRRLRVVGPGVEVLRRRLVDLDLGDPVFTFRDQRFKRDRYQPWSPSALERRWHDVVDSAGLTERAPTPHWLRHSHVAICLAAGMDLAEIKRRVGHASIQMTVDTYGRMADGMREETAARLDELFGVDRQHLRLVDPDRTAEA